MKKLIISSLCLLAAICSNAQQETMYTQYMFNMQEFNPAYAGSRGVISATGIHRSQWTGLEGAPRTQGITIQSPFLNNKIGGGLGIVNDKIGPTNITSLSLDLAYRLQLNENSTIAFGAKASGNFYQGSFADVNVTDNSDAAFAANMQSRFTPNIGFGAYYTFKNYYAGISSPRIAQRNFYERDTKNTIVEAKRHYYLTGGAIFTLNEIIKLRPSALLKVTTAAPAQVDVTATVIYKDKIWSGVMARTGSALGFIIGANVNNAIQIGYSYDYSRGAVNGLSSHEIVLRYDMVKKDGTNIPVNRYF